MSECMNLNDIVLNGKYDEYLLRIFEPLGEKLVIFVPRQLTDDFEIKLIIKVVKLLMGWDDAEVKDLTSIVREHGEGVPVDKVIDALNNTASDLTDDQLHFYLSLILPSVNKPTIIIPREREIRGVRAIMDVSTVNKNIATVMWQPTEPSEEFMKIVKLHEVGSTTSLDSKYVKQLLFKMYKKMGEDLVNDPSNMKLGYMISQLVDRSLKQTIDTLMDTLMDPILVIKEVNKIIVEACNRINS